MPPTDEERARALYVGILGMTEIEKPPELRDRGGAWFASGSVQLHLGVEKDFRPAKKAHPALRCRDFNDLLQRLNEASVAVVSDGSTLSDGSEHAYIEDPFGNRIELIADRQG